MYLRNRVIGQNEIQDVCNSQVYIVIDVPKEDGGPYTVKPEIGFEMKKVTRTAKTVLHALDRKKKVMNMIWRVVGKVGLWLVMIHSLLFRRIVLQHQVVFVRQQY